LKITAEISRVAGGDGHYFCGYYDLCPWDAPGRRLLALRAEFIDRLPSGGDEVDIVLVEVDGRRRFLGKTRAWNWQLGCRLQWLPPDHSSRIIYNTEVGGKLGAEILEIESGRVQRLPCPIFAVTPDAKFALTLDFAELRQRRKSYGYTGRFQPEGGGVFRMELATGRVERIVSPNDLREMTPRGKPGSGQDWVNHILLAPGGERFCFLHRWNLADGGTYSRLLTAALDGSGLRCLLDSGQVTHCGWVNDRELVAWGRRSGAVAGIIRRRGLRNLVRPVLPLARRFFSRHRLLHQRVAGDDYLLLRDPGGVVGPVGEHLFPGDGHCTFSSGGRLMLTDTYPDSKHQRQLLLYDRRDQELSLLAALDSLPPGVAEDWDQSGARCDLHPRWSRDGRAICFDSVHEGTRGIYQARLIFPEEGSCRN